jgi:hypothetical protein
VRAVVVDAEKANIGRDVAESGSEDVIGSSTIEVVD